MPKIGHMMHKWGIIQCIIVKLPGKIILYTPILNLNLPKTIENFHESNCKDQIDKIKIIGTKMKSHPNYKGTNVIYPYICTCVYKNKHEKESKKSFYFSIHRIPFHLTPCLVWHKQEKNSFGILVCGKFYVWFDIKQEKNSFLIPPNSCFGGFTIPSKMVGFGKNSFGILPFDQNTSDCYSKHNMTETVW